MPSRIFDQLNVINIAEGYSTGPSYSNASGALSNVQFANFGLNGSGSDSNPAGAGCSAAATYDKSGTVDFTTFPAIPLTAKITKVIYRLTHAASATATASVSNASICSATINYVGGIVDSDSGVSSATAGGANGGTEVITADYSSAPLTYAAFVTLFGTVSLSVSAQLSASAQPAPINNAAIGWNHSINGWSIEVFYSTAPFSWYVKPKTVIVNGRPIQIADGPAIQVADDEEPPAGYNFYGTVEDFPSGPILYWWFSIYWWRFFIQSILIPEPIRLGYPAEWTSQINAPTCTGCLSLTLQGNPVLVADASGIYQLLEGKTNDTMYFRDDTLTVTTEDVMFPPPMIKTALVP